MSIWRSSDFIQDMKKNVSYEQYKRFYKILNEQFYLLEFLEEVSQVDKKMVIKLLLENCLIFPIFKHYDLFLSRELWKLIFKEKKYFLEF